MATFTTTPATVWVVPTTVTISTGRVDPADTCNVIDVPGEPDFDATCQDHVVQDAEA